MAPPALRRPIGAIAFDFDGVLAESLDIKTRAFASLYRPHGEAVVRQVVDYHLRHGGVSRYDKIRHLHRELLGKTLTERELDALAEQFSGEVEAAVVQSEWVPGAREFLEAESRRLPCYVVSATPVEELRRIVERRGMAQFFRGVFGAPETKAAILARIGQAHPGANWLVVGDSLEDYEAAAQAAMAFAGRLKRGHENPFPPAVPTLEDLSSLGRLIS